MNKSILCVMLGVLFICGCGSKDEAKYQGVVENNDYVGEGMKYLTSADVPRAIKSFDEAIRQDPSDPDRYIILGQVYMRLNNLPKAIDTFSAATKVAPNHGEAYYLLAVSQGLNGEKEAAVKSAQKSVASFQKAQDEEKFARALILLKSLMDNKTGKAQIPDDMKDVGI